MLDALERKKFDRGNQSRIGRLVLFAVSCAAVALLIMAGLWLTRLSRLSLRERDDAFAGRVHVNFVTYPFEAKIYLDNVLQVDGQGNALRTPCTEENLPAKVYHVIFQNDKLEKLDVGEMDFATQRRVEGHW
ncbi:MAG: hypothetical protein ACWGMZ_11145 [Thermoguttaceae bacterium]